MNLVVHCPNCPKRYQVGEELLGRRIKCAGCGQPFVAARREAPTSAASPGIFAPSAPAATIVKNTPAKPAAARPVALHAAPPQASRPPQAMRQSHPASLPSQPAPRPPQPAMGRPQAPATAPQPNAAAANPFDLGSLASLVGEELGQPRSSHQPERPSAAPAAAVRAAGPRRSPSWASATSTKVVAGGGSVLLFAIVLAAKIALRIAARELTADHAPTLAVQSVAAPAAMAPGNHVGVDVAPAKTSQPPAPWPPGAYEAKVNEAVGYFQTIANLLAGIQDKQTAQQNFPNVEAAYFSLIGMLPELDRMESTGQRSVAEANFAERKIRELNELTANIRMQLSRLNGLAAQLRMQDRLDRIGQIGFTGGKHHFGYVSHHEPVQVQPFPAQPAPQVQANQGGPNVQPQQNLHGPGSHLRHGPRHMHRPGPDR